MSSTGSLVALGSAASVVGTESGGTVSVPSTTLDSGTAGSDVAVVVALESADESSLLFEQAARPSPTTTIRAAMWRRRFRGDGKVVPPDVTRTCAGR